MRKYIYIWLPAMMLIYLAYMAISNKDQMFAQGEQTQFYLIVVLDLIVIIAMVIFLKKRGELRRRRENHDHDSDKKS